MISEAENVQKEKLFFPINSSEKEIKLLTGGASPSDEKSIAPINKSLPKRRRSLRKRAAGIF